MSTTAWEKFEAVNPEAAEHVADSICSAVAGHYQGYTVEGVTVADVERLDREGGNHRISGQVQTLGRTYNFQAESGNWSGFVMEEWELEEVAVYESVAPATPKRIRAWLDCMFEPHEMVVCAFCLSFGKYGPKFNETVYYGPCNAAGEKESWFTAEYLGLSIVAK